MELYQGQELLYDLVLASLVFTMEIKKKREIFSSNNGPVGAIS